MLYNFKGTNGDGAAPAAGLIMDSAGNLYGATAGGGSADRGTLFKLDTTGHETVLYNFTGTNGDGANPLGPLTMDSAGNLFGTNLFGGSDGVGTVFKLDAAGHETVLYSFTDINGDGAAPNAGLIMDSAGNLYGTTMRGGSTGGICQNYGGGNGCGIVFKVDATGNETVLYNSRAQMEMGHTHTPS